MFVSSITSVLKVDCLLDSTAHENSNVETTKHTSVGSAMPGVMGPYGDGSLEGPPCTAANPYGSGTVMFATKSSPSTPAPFMSVGSAKPKETPVKGS